MLIIVITDANTHTHIHWLWQATDTRRKTRALQNGMVNGEKIRTKYNLVQGMRRLPTRVKRDSASRCALKTEGHG